jgi:NAD(P)-dependent dehydrogenase (short-subunit alcohol dehydrogenase family)
MARSIFITGGSRGLGLALVSTFLAEGDQVYAGIRRETPDLLRLREEHPSSLHPVVLDVVDEESVRNAAREVTRKLDGLDILVNNAAVLMRETSAKTIEHLDFESMRVTLDVNLYGVLRVLKHFLPLVRSGPGAIILNLSSEAASLADCNRDSWYDYGISKVGINMTSRILQNYLKEKSIKVLAVHPGWMRTRMGGMEATRTPEEAARSILALTRRTWRVDDPIYVDSDGNPMRW